MNIDHTSRELRGIAIIGMAGRFPGAVSLEQFWENLQGGTESITFFAEKEPGRVNAAGVLPGFADFDADFFGMTPREAEMTDPQQRIFLECAYEALESAGYSGTACPERVGVYGSCTVSAYMDQVLSHEEMVESMGTMQAVIGNLPDFLSTRVSYKLKLTGPSVTVQTACSSSLVAVHMACQSLWAYECDMAIAGGLSVKAKQTEGLPYQEGSILSPDGHCRAFDAAAQGTVSGNGGGVVLLKRLADALEDRDPIMAVIRGTAVNNDGAEKVGFTAPSVLRQAEVIKEALAIGDIDPETIGYVEAHGTGTALGDPIEVAALTEAYRAYTSARQYCALGSVKTNIGHLDSGAGIAGLIKTVLSMQNGLIPPSLHYTAPNPKINFAESPFYVNTELAQWQTRGTRRRAGVSSFGMGGTNAHVILEEASYAEQDSEHSAARSASGLKSAYLLPLSARSPRALGQAAANLIDYMRSEPAAALRNIAYTLTKEKHSHAG